jgi:hypothetical protein
MFLMDVTGALRFCRARNVAACMPAVLTGMLLAAMTTGCSHVVTQNAPYYRDGPHQLDPPNGIIDAGTYALVLGEKDGYKHLIAGTGEAGHVWNGHVVTVWEWWRMQSEQQDE